MTFPPSVLVCQLVLFRSCLGSRIVEISWVHSFPVHSNEKAQFQRTLPGPLALSTFGSEFSASFLNHRCGCCVVDVSPGRKYFDQLWLPVIACICCEKKVL